MNRFCTECGCRMPATACASCGGTDWAPKDPLEVLRALCDNLVLTYESIFGPGSFALIETNPQITGLCAQVTAMITQEKS